MWLRLRERFTFVVLLKVVAIECTDTGWQAAELAAERQRRDADFAEERALLKAQNSRLREGLAAGRNSGWCCIGVHETS